MLVLSRRVGDSITIGDDVVVTILEVRSDVVRVGIDAPRSVRVHRAELLEQLESSNKQAASPSPDTVQSLRDALQKRSSADGEAGSTDEA
ncbi:carbon storage regulator CsrA [Nocardioides aequoreus]|uniref:carbon storage regulator CsrA n=1 Tax=Nocardioides aequoreus TaxID=397278 RepID=UPI0004C36F35|nr:carbon storage regulator CsrA [Nocardioides aequoreus]